MIKNYLTTLILFWGVCFAYAQTLIGDIVYTLNEAQMTAQVEEKTGGYTGEITIPAEVVVGGKSYRVVAIGNGAFYRAVNLTKVNLPATLTTIDDDAFYGCVRLQDMAIPEGVTYIGYEAFGMCHEFTKVKLPETALSLGKKLFVSCRKLTAVTFPSKLAQIPDRIFHNCQKLSEVVLPQSIDSIGYSAFWGCLALKNIVIPPSVKDIDESAFARSGLVQIELPEGMTEIDTLLFSNCTSLTTVILPSTLTHVRKYAFQKCTNLQKVVSKALVAPVYETDAFEAIPVNTPLHIDTEATGYEAWDKFLLVKDFTTGIAAVKSVAKKNKVYDLCGKEVNNSYRGLRIINGQKVM